MGEELDRRGFIRRLVGITIGLTAAASFVPVVNYLIPKSTHEGENIFTDTQGNAVTEGQIKEGLSLVGTSKYGPAIIIKHSGKLIAYSDVCTHLGCLVKWSPTEEVFICPCHAGKFDVNGKNISGPPPSPLPVYDIRINKDGNIVLSKP